MPRLETPIVQNPSLLYANSAAHIVDSAGARHPAQPIRFSFEHMVLYDRDSTPEWIGYSACTLLNYVRQFVAEQELSVRGVWVVLAGGKVKIRAPSEGEGSDGRGLGSDMHADVGEVCAERSLHFGLHIAG
jgi:hypothetical protein